MNHVVKREGGVLEGELEGRVAKEGEGRREEGLVRFGNIYLDLSPACRAHKPDT